ncbi:hypothetical protein COOONC_09681 [Cooperia oncophora]
MQFGTSDERYLRDLPPPSDTDRSFRVSGRRITLTRDQKDAVRVGTGNLPIVALQAAFGTGKTLVGSLIAALTAKPGSTVIVTTSTNAAVAQFAETLLSLDDFPRLKVTLLRAKKTVGHPGGAQTRSEEAAEKIFAGPGWTTGERRVCAKFKRYRQLLEDYIENPDRVPTMSDRDKEEYTIAEQYVSQTLKRMVRIMFTVRRPSVI